MRTFRAARGSGLKDGGLAEVVHRAAGGLGGNGTLANRLEGVRLSPSSLSHLMMFHPRRYTRNLVYRDRAVEVMVLCWAPGAATPVHGHDGQQCWLQVTHGKLAQQELAVAEGGRVPGPARVVLSGKPAVLRAGDSDFRNDESVVHRLVALEPSVSVHVYAAPIDRCLVFDVAGGKCSYRTLRYDSVAANASPSLSAPAPL